MTNCHVASTCSLSSTALLQQQKHTSASTARLAITVATHSGSIVLVAFIVLLLHARYPRAADPRHPPVHFPALALDACLGRRPLHHGALCSPSRGAHARQDAMHAKMTWCRCKPRGADARKDVVQMHIHAHMNADMPLHRQMHIFCACAQVQNANLDAGMSGTLLALGSCRQTGRQLEGGSTLFSCSDLSVWGGALRAIACHVRGLLVCCLSRPQR